MVAHAKVQLYKLSFAQIAKVADELLGDDGCGYSEVDQAFDDYIDLWKALERDVADIDYDKQFYGQDKKLEKLLNQVRYYGEDKRTGYYSVKQPYPDPEKEGNAEFGKTVEDCSLRTLMTLIRIRTTDLKNSLERVEKTWMMKRRDQESFTTAYVQRVGQFFESLSELCDKKSGQLAKGEREWDESELVAQPRPQKAEAVAEAVSNELPYGTFHVSGVPNGTVLQPIVLDKGGPIFLNCVLLPTMGEPVPNELMISYCGVNYRLAVVDLETVKGLKFE